MMRIKKKTFVLLISYLSAAVLSLGGFALAESTVGGNYGVTARNGYRHAFDETSSAVADLSDALRKGAYATGPAMAEAVSSEAYGDCLAAQMTMAVLPFSTQELEQTAAFVNRVGDYACYLGRTAAEKGGFDDAERAELSKLAQTSSLLSSQLLQLQADIAAGEVLMDDPENTLRTGTQAYKNSATLSAALLKNESAFPEQDELQYDGKYSYKSFGPEGDIITQGEARKAAAEFLGVDESRLKTGSVSSAEKVCYYFTLPVTDGEAAVLVDAGSGMVRSYTSSRVVVPGKVSVKEACAAAEKFIEDRGYGDVALTEADETGGCVACRFAPLAGDAKCYPDLIKISIATDNGGVQSFDASDYADNHKQRSVPENIVTESAARAAIPGSLKIESSGKAFIMSPGGRDVFCREFGCVGKNGDKVTVFVNALTGKQQEIEID